MAFDQDKFDKEWNDKYRAQSEKELYNKLKSLETKWKSKYPQINTVSPSGQYETMIKVKETGAYTTSWGGIGSSMSVYDYNIMADEFKKASDEIIDKWNAKYDEELAKVKGENPKETTPQEDQQAQQQNAEDEELEEIDPVVIEPPASMDSVVNETIEGNNKPEVSESIFSGTSGETNKVSESATEEGHPNSSIGITDTGEHEGIDTNNAMNKGVTYPIIRINDHYFTEAEIMNFKMESGYYKSYHDYTEFHKPMKGFVPTFDLAIHTQATDLEKNNAIKCGDVCSVFFAQGHGMIKSMRCDFVITSVISNDKNQEIIKNATEYFIKGELKVDNLRNAANTFAFSGTSRGALMDAASKLGLSYMFCDPDDTEDVMIWQSTKTLEEYVKEVAMHSWKNFNSFFEAWIDPRYGLSFQNINKLLVEDGLDEPIDVTVFTNMLNRSRGVDGKKEYKTDAESKASSRPQLKILTNIAQDDDAMTPYFITSFKVFNRAAEIQKEIGLNCTQNYIIDNPGCADSATEVEMKYSMPLNETKLRKGFYVLVGPGRNLTYSGGDEASGSSYVEKSFAKTGGMIAETMSDGDQEAIMQNASNSMSSGNTHKFYNVAYQHNIRNLLQLQKQITYVDLLGANLSIMRGEKVPVILLDNNRAQSALKQGTLSGKGLQALMYENASGWYIIDGIMWEWNPDEISPSNNMSAWKTHLKLVRREWPIPGETYVPGSDIDEDQHISVNVNTSKGTSVEGVNIVSIAAEDAADMQEISESGATVSNDTEEQEEDTALSEVPLTGLKEYMKDIYKAVYDAAEGKVTLVSARRWAVDIDGQKVDGNAFVKKYGYYKCANAKGETMYFKNNNSKHLYGEAFDIINGPGQDFNKLMTDIIMKSPEVLRLMYLNGVSAYIEQAKDDNGATSKHYHFGTDTIKQAQFWASVKAINGNTKIPGTVMDFKDYESHNVKQGSEITHTDLDEILYEKKEKKKEDKK